MKKIFLILTLFTIYQATAQNQIKNPGFEEEEGWNNWGGGVKDEDAHSGDFSLRIENQEFKWTGADQIVILPEGAKRVTVSGWMKTKDVVKGANPWEQARIAVEFYDADGNLVGGYPQATAQAEGTTDWRPYKRLYPVPAGANNVKIQLALGNATGTVWFDDIEVLIAGEGGKQLQAGEAKVEKPQPEDFIRLNQIGYLPNSKKEAVVISAPTDKFYVIRAKKDTVHRGTLTKKGVWKPSGEEASIADFSKVTKPGSYVISVPGYANSHPFEISADVYHELGKASLKSYYYQRVSTELKEEHAGKWARKAGHPDTEVLVHSSAANASRPEGTKISSPYGWYDAGDYNKYIVNSGISTYTLLALYEHFPEFTDTIKVNIPESGNQIPDLLDEAYFNVRWMITMQDPSDGGVYHKLTNPGFDGEVMPHEAKEPRYVVMKSTAAALDFAAVMAQSARVYKKYKPAFADSCLEAAKKAYAWAKKNPDIYYNQNEMNTKHKPSIVTGEYGDGNVKDEFQWAAIELFITTGEKSYYEQAGIASSLDQFSVPAWPNVNTLGLLTLTSMKDKYATIPDIEAIKARIIKIADELKANADASEFGIPMGGNENDFVWGSNSTAANQGIILIQAYRLTNNKEYLNAAMANLDYILGRNGTGYSFVTGYGEKSTKRPHHRPSQADKIDEPVPGFLAGGPNPGQQDKGSCSLPYPSNLPAKSYLDHGCSYASNEIAINWNAPLTYLTFAVEALNASAPKAVKEKKGKKKK